MSDFFQTGAMELFANLLRKLVLALAILAGVSLLTMVLVTTVDVILRKCGHPLSGAYDMVKIAAALTIACGLPYTTAIKGHVAVEYFFHKLGRRGRVVADTVIRLLIMTLFSLLAWQLVRYGARLRESGEVSMTLQLPVFWVPYVMACSCAVVVLVTLYHLFHPGKALLKP
jgi:TRAP-type C4-dicarboxylate transport system permease small subunit